MSENGHGRDFYIKIWGVLLVLLFLSVMGPFVGQWTGLLWITLVTAFGIAIVKAYLVVAHFMHLNVEKSYIKYMLATSLMFMLLMFAGVAPDVLRHQGQRWVNQAARDHIAAEQAKQAEMEAGGHDHHGDH